MRRLAVFVSGEGSGLMGVAERVGAIGVEVVLVVADRPCRAIARAEALGLPVRMVDPTDAHALLDLLDSFGVELVLLSGYLRRVPAAVVERFFGRMVNIHPSLLPAFPGRDAIAAALAYGVKVTGATLHLVDEEIDHGPIVLQAAVPVLPGDDWAALRDRLRPVEVRLMVEGLRLLAEDRLVVEGRTVSWRTDG
jgi:phosphoribosylglycinamide formyltransferase-1